jgi:NAD(P)-dependent dehydrogenase (short-subunit alcohol dehydrogenase family)
MNSTGGKLTGQVAWIGGGASGIGAAAAELFAGEGASVVIADVQRELGEKVAGRINAACESRRDSPTCVFLPTDVTREDQVQASIEYSIKQFGGLQIVINCAGIVHATPLDAYSEKDWDELMAVNVKSIFFAFKHAWPHFKQQRRSYMVNVGSISSFIGQAGTPAYTASKGAVLQLTKSIALDYAAFGLRCNCVCPGVTDTPMLRYHLSKTPDPEGLLRERLQRVPMGVAMQPIDIAKAALYLSCEDSSGITGTSLLVDGGYLAAAEWHAPPRTAFME